jgi:hypothetical protein
MTITILAKKPASVTVCLLLHEAFRKAYKTVAIQDWDAQRTSNKTLAFMNGQRAEPDASLGYFADRHFPGRPVGSRGSVFNRAQFGGPNADLSNSNFGVITTTISNYATGRGTLREFQLPAKFIF